MEAMIPAFIVIFTILMGIALITCLIISIILGNLFAIIPWATLTFLWFLKVAKKFLE